jgi:formate transporter
MIKNGADNSPVSPYQIANRAEEIAAAKTQSGFVSTFLLSILAGMYIGFGGIFSAVVAIGMSGTWPFGFMKLLQGLAFSLGLILVVVGGAELFTGNMLMIIAWARHKISIGSILRNWSIVYFGNFLGSILLAYLFTLGKSSRLSDGELGRILFNIASLKLNYSFLQAIILGILCNILVCLAVWLSYSAKNTTDKILAVFFPISAFIAAGFEHSIANMFLIPVTFFIKIFDPMFSTNLTIDLSKFTWPQFLIQNLLPVTIGNIIGGALIVGLIYHLSFRKQ